MTGPHLRRLSEALLHAYPSRDGLEQVLYFDLDKPLGHIVGNVGMSEAVFAVITQARAEGWLDTLIDAILVDRRGNPLLRQWAADIGWQTEPDQLEALSNLERTIRAHAPELDPMRWRQRLAQQESRTCRIDAETATGYVPFGTGFLIGPDLCLTAGHVIEEALGASHKPEDLRLWFPDEQACGLHTDWQAARSPRSPVDELANPNGMLPEQDQLDFAVLRIAGSPGTDRLSSGQPRGWITTMRERALEQFDELVLLQHLDGESQTMAFGAVIDFNGNHTRLRHTVNTAHGSSGAPCFDISLDLVAVHQGGDPDKRRSHLPTHNVAIPALAIRRALPAALNAFRRLH
nr:effector-associated domain EAD1-containing protein [Micromonospora zingiberis]